MLSTPVILIGSMRVYKTNTFILNIVDTLLWKNLTGGKGQRMYGLGGRQLQS